MIVYHIISITDLIRSDDPNKYNDFFYNIENIKNLKFEETHENCNGVVLVCVDQSPSVYNKIFLDRFNKIVEIVRKSNINAKFVLDSTFIDESLIKPNKDIIFVSLWRMLAFKFCIKQKRNTNINFDKNLGLFLPGHINRYNRLVLFKELYERKLINRIIWSCQYSKEELENLSDSRKKWFSEYSDSEWEKFVNILPKSLDIINFEKTKHFGCGFPYDVTLYENTLFSVIAESDILHYALSDNGPTTVSEKTWKAIMNFHPFIVSGNTGTIAKLENWGYKTFKEYTTFPNYNDQTPQKRIEQTAKNIEFFARNLEQNQEQVKLNCIHNYKLLKQHYATDINELNLFLQNDWHANIADRIIDNIALGNMFMEINTIS